MNSTLSTVSVITPCYNGSMYLRETLESVLAQTYQALEVIVVDDGSTDDSAAIAESYGWPVRVIRQANQGESVARNRGMDEAKGDWIALLDADDVWSPEKLERQIAAIREDVVAIHTNVFFFGSASGKMDLSRTPAEERYRPDFVAQASPLHISSLLVRTATAPRFPAWTKFAEDMLFALELVLKGRVELVPEFLCGYRKHATSQSNRLAVDTLWHDSVRRWVAENEARIGGAMRARIENDWICRIVSLAWAARERRDWDAYWAYRKHAAQFTGHGQVDCLMSNRIYPRIAYSVMDGCLAVKNRLVGRRTAPTTLGAAGNG